MRDAVRKTLDRNILYLYENAFQSLTFPVEPLFVIAHLDKCRYISYATLARQSGQSIEAVIKACCSTDGCTHYDPKRGRYLVAVNESGRSKERIRWTMAHELGHIAAGHFIELANRGTKEVSSDMLPEMEEEADYFAASFLSPIPAIRDLHASSADDIRLWFGLSYAAAEYRWAEYKREAKTPSPFDEFFLRHSARSATKRPRVRPGIRPIDIWPDSPVNH